MPSAVIPSVFSYPAMPLARQQVHQRYVHPGPLVLGTDPLKSRTPTADRDRTVSRRSKPSSRTALIGEQPNPWDLLQPQDAMSRHRGAKQCRRYGLLGIISLLSPAYLLSVERWPFHTGTTGSLWPSFDSARPVSLAVRRAYAIALNERFPTALSPPIARLRYDFGRRPPQSNYPPRRVPDPGSRIAVRRQQRIGRYFKGGST